MNWIIALSLENNRRIGEFTQVYAEFSKIFSKYIISDVTGRYYIQLHILYFLQVFFPNVVGVGFKSITIRLYLDFYGYYQISTKFERLLSDFLTFLILITNT